MCHIGPGLSSQCAQKSDRPLPRGQRKARDPADLGLWKRYSDRSALAELRSATSGFEAVFLTLFHSRVTGQQAGSLQGRTVAVLDLQQRTGDAVADRAGSGAAVMLAFALGTVPLLLAFAMLGALMPRAWTKYLRKLGAVLVTAMGLKMLLGGLLLLR